MLSVNTKPSGNSSGSSAPEIRPTKYFTEDSIPVQWQAWLRFTRNTPPSLEELQRDQERIRLVKQRAEELERKWQEEKLRLEVDAHRQLEERKALATQHLDSAQSPATTDKAVKQIGQDISSELSSKTTSETLSTENLSLPKGGPDHFQPGEWKPKNKGRS
ncbi:hypothetical protein BKA69DRAFT_1125498 [Paraphysoderma sedebokerense]|nr:hypothetical protein BKA69DRAFT_1125498 [Paraphysoderma sedebokerense]